MYFLLKEVLSLFKALDIIHENVVVLFEKRVALSLSRSRTDYIFKGNIC